MATRPTADVLAELAASLLAVRTLGPGDDLFACGGDSLGAVRLVARIRASLGRDVPPSAVFDHPTPETLATFVDRAPEVPPEDRDLVCAGGEESPLTATQRAMWAHEVFVRGTPLNNCLFAWRIRGPLDVPSLERALSEVVRRHEILRSTFPYQSGGTAAQVEAGWVPEVPVLDLHADADREATLRKRARALAAEPFDVETRPPIRLWLVRLDEQEHALVAAVHHIAIDGWSSEILLDEVMRLHDAFRGGRPSPLPPRASPRFADHARREAARASHPIVLENLENWRRRLEGHAGPVDLPEDSTTPDAPTWLGDRCCAAVPPRRLAALEALARSECATLATVLLAGFLVVLRRLRSADDLTVGLLVAGRRLAAEESVIGPFFRLLPLRFDLAGATLREVVRRTRETVLEGLDGQEVSWDALVRALGPRTNPGRNPLVNVAFQMRSYPRGVRAATGRAIEEIGLHGGIARFDLLAEVERRGGETWLSLEYPVRLFRPSTVEGLLASWHDALEGLATDPDRALESL